MSGLSPNPNRRQHESDGPASTRRQFLGILGGGLVVLLRAPRLPGADQDKESGLEAWLRINPDGTVHGLTGKVEYGQGTRTGFVQIIAEELSIPLDRVRVIMGDTDGVPFDPGTYASLSTEMMRPRFQRAAARAGELLRRRAGTRWDVPIEKTRLKAGEVLGPGGRSIGIGELVKGDPLIDVLDYEPTPKPPEEYSLVGQSVARVDGLERVTGAAVYGTDLRVPGMMHGAVLRPPFWKARLVRLDTSQAKQAGHGVKVIREGDFVGVVARNERTARRAVQLLEVRWEGTADWDTSKINAQLRDALGQAEVVQERGDESPAWSASEIRREALYETSFVYHATMEPQAALANVREGEAWIVASTQRPFGVRDQIASLLKIPASKVHVKVSEIGGGFGRKNEADAPREAVLLSKHAGCPVRVVWTREEDFKHSYYRPAACLQVRAGLDKKGAILAWDYAMISSGGHFSSTRDVISFYRSAFHRTRFALSPTPVPIGSFRGLGSPINAFARESFMDELALAAGMDPLTFRLRALGNTMPRLSAVLRAAVKASGWKPATQPREDGRGWGLACCLYRDKTYVAQVAQVHMTDGGQSLQVEKVTTALDCGFVVNPDAVRRQAEGGVAMAASYTLGEAVLIDRSSMSNATFRRYPILRSGAAPRVETILVGQSENPSVGVGEPVTVPVSAALANAYYDATGNRQRTLPFF